ncbi:hypothetical protein EYR41_010457 [Orbilia oligospora]|uniref:Uncharacterized protein n=1 Tax=Orbilia oligospora TaxID=2813651 RepID=A0A7C8PYE9_ORBOL|nr:hypothetical protein TWF751_000058 [Orbilia oligospora]TGJ64398.1 hypothetical protein EYR41_010457 [Orbilia oligospora]
MIGYHIRFEKLSVPVHAARKTFPASSLSLRTRKKKKKKGKTRYGQHIDRCQRSRQGSIEGKPNRQMQMRKRSQLCTSKMCTLFSIPAYHSVSEAQRGRRT